MTWMPTNGQQLPPEVIEAMLELSGQGDEKDALKEQLALSRALIDRGTSLDRAPSSALGGLGHVFSKGVQGYLGGQQMKENMDAMKAMKATGIGNRRTYLQGLFGGAKDMGGATRLMDRDPYNEYEEPFGG